MIAKPKLGMLLFLSSESIFFVLLILAFIYFRDSHLNNGVATPHGSVDPAHTGLYSIALFSSSLTIWLASHNLKRGNHRMLRFWLLATVVLGAIFLFFQGQEYLRLLNAKGVTIDRDVFSSAFFTLTGFHGAHVAVGLIALAITLGLAQGGDFKDGKGAVGFDTVAIYWHYVDAVWVVIFSVVYIWTAFS